MKLAVDKMDGHGLSNTEHCEHLSRRISNAILATEGYPKMEHFSYISRWANT